MVVVNTNALNCFVKGRSCVTQTLPDLGKRREALDHGSTIDFAKAFDSVLPTHEDEELQH